MKIRTRLLVVCIATLATALAVLLVVGNLLLSRAAGSDTSRLLHTRVEAELADVTVSRSGVNERHAMNDDQLDILGWLFSGDQIIERPAGVPAALNRAVIALAHSRHGAQASAPGGVRLMAEPLFAHGFVGSVVVGVSVSQLSSLRRTVLSGSIALAATMLLVAGFVIGRALRRALSPVREMTAAAEAWGAHDLDRRFALSGPADELTGLAATLDRMLGRIATSRRNEQQLANDVAHELRTPLSAIRGQAELAADDPDPDAARRAVEAILARAEAMGDAIDTLLSIARRDLDPQSGRTDLMAVASGFDVEVRSEGPVPRVQGDPEVVRRALAPLIDNARRHSRTTVTVELSGDDGRARITVRDDGPGLEEGMSETAFEPGVRGVDEPTGGAGLGLPLARRIARTLGGEVRAADGPGGCFVLELPASER